MARADYLMARTTNFNSQILQKETKTDPAKSIQFDKIFDKSGFALCGDRKNSVSCVYKNDLSSQCLLVHFSKKCGLNA